MTHESVPLDELVGAFVDAATAFSSDRQDEELDEKIAALGTTIVARGNAGAHVLRDLLVSDNEQVQLNAAAWLSELDPCGATPTLEHLEREGSGFEIRGFAELKLHNNRERGLLPARGR